MCTKRTLVENQGNNGSILSGLNASCPNSRRPLREQAIAETCFQTKSSDLVSCYATDMHLQQAHPALIHHQ
jgi:hypothetical protein